MDRDTFIKGVRENRNQMYVIALSILKNPEDAEDIVQQALLTAYEKLDALKEDDKFRSWMMSIVVNEAKMYIRKNSRMVYMEDMEAVVERAREGRNGEDDVWELVLLLKKELSTVVILYYGQGYRVNEISKIMRIPPGTVKSRLAKARALLKKRLEES